MSSGRTRVYGIGIILVLCLVGGSTAYFQFIYLPSIPSVYEPDYPTIPYVEGSEVDVDGVLGVNEYGGHLFVEATGIDVYWQHDGTNLYVCLVSPYTGWVAMGFAFEGTGMVGANIIQGYVDDETGLVYVVDQMANPDRTHPADVDAGGTNDVLESAGSQNATHTVIEFVYPLYTEDSRDYPMEPGDIFGLIISNHETSDEETLYHSHRDLLTFYIEPMP